MSLVIGYYWIIRCDQTWLRTPVIDGWLNGKIIELNGELSIDMFDYQTSSNQIRLHVSHHFSITAGSTSNIFNQQQPLVFCI